MDFAKSFKTLSLLAFCPGEIDQYLALHERLLADLRDKLKATERTEDAREIFDGCARLLMLGVRQSLFLDSLARKERRSN
jgi:hypothetical protein